MTQNVYHGPAPFLLTEGLVRPVMPAGVGRWADVTATSRMVVVSR